MFVAPMFRDLLLDARLAVRGRGVVAEELRHRSRILALLIAQDLEEVGHLHGVVAGARP